METLQYISHFHIKLVHFSLDFLKLDRFADVIQCQAGDSISGNTL